MTEQKQKVYAYIDEIIEIYKINGFTAVEYDENCEDTSTIEPHIIFIIDINTNDHKERFFEEKNKEREDIHKYDICFLYNDKSYLRHKKI